jgi:serine phosphatase RsbU (regulator of sigma subunit)
LSTATGELRVATAGHLPPLIRRGSGAVEVVAVSPAPPLGLAGDAPVEASVHTEPGDVVVLFTDGLVERPGVHLDEGIGRLAAALRSVDGDPETLCDLVLERVIAPGQRSDDVALLAVARQ